MLILISFALTLVLYISTAIEQKYLRQQMVELQTYVIRQIEHTATDETATSTGDNIVVRTAPKEFHSQALEHSTGKDTVHREILYKYQVAPVIFSIPKFSEKIKNKVYWNSSAFFAFKGGYLMYMSVRPSHSNYLSIYLHLMKGPYDNDLEWGGYWPLRGVFKIELINHPSNYSQLFVQNYRLCGWCTCRVVKGTEAPSGFGYPNYVSYDILLGQNNSSLLQNDTLHIQISYIPSILRDGDIYHVFSIQVIGIMIIFIAGCIHALQLYIPFVFFKYCIKFDSALDKEILQLNTSVSLKCLRQSLLIAELLLVADTLVMVEGGYMNIDDSTSAFVHFALLRLFVVSLFNYCGVITSISFWRGKVDNDIFCEGYKKHGCKIFLLCNTATKNIT